MPELSPMVLVLATSVQAALFETFLWNMVKGVAYILIAVTLWFLLRKLSHIRPLKRKRLKR
ncbi:MAG: hypothetical protein QW358_02945 [Candidatus Hadarchaeum sp.]